MQKDKTNTLEVGLLVFGVMVSDIALRVIFDQQIKTEVYYCLGIFKI
jgi:hypothetical protein